MYMRVCKLYDCNKKHASKGYCKSHYLKYVIGYTELYKRRKIRATMIRTKLLDKFGYKCRCCGESQIDFLCIDHINNDGNIHRKNQTTGKRFDYLKIWKDILKNGDDSNFQVLCMNCNWGKRLTGICPHKDIRNE